MTLGALAIGHLVALKTADTSLLATRIQLQPILESRLKLVLYGSRKAMNLKMGNSRVRFDDKKSNSGILSRDGLTSFSHDRGMNNIARVYRVKEKTEDNLVGFIKSKLNGVVLAVSGKGNCVTVTIAGKLEIHDVGEDTRKLIC